MKEALISWFIENLGGKVGKEMIIFLISMVPILELRGGLLTAGPAFLDVPMWEAIPICIVGNLIPIPFILLLITRIFDWMKGTKRLKPLVEKLEKKGHEQELQHRKIRILGVVCLCRHSPSRHRGMDRFPHRGAAWHPFSEGVSGNRAGRIPGSVFDDRAVLRGIGRNFRIVPAPVDTCLKNPYNE